MKVGDLVRHTPIRNGQKIVGTKVGLIIEMTEKKCWRTNELGKKVNWDKVDPEPHAVVLYDNTTTIVIPTNALEVI